MESWILAILAIGAMALGAKLLYPQKKPGKHCQSCPAFQTCGGNKPRCPRRSGAV